MAGNAPEEKHMAGADSARPAAFTPMTEEQLRASTIGEPEARNGPITLVDYDPDWPRLYDREADRIRSALGDRVLMLEHAGSTSVPGLAAKPKIDFVLVVGGSGGEVAYFLRSGVG